MDINKMVICCYSDQCIDPIDFGVERPKVKVTTGLEGHGVGERGILFYKRLLFLQI